MKTINIKTLEGGTLGFPVIDVTDDPTFKADSLGKDLAGNNLAFPIIINGSGGGGGGDETDPIYTADKPNIALKSDVSDVQINGSYLALSETNELSLTLYKGAGGTIESNLLTLPSGGGATPIYIESELVPTIEIPGDGAVKTIVSTINLPETMSTGADLEFHIQGNITRTGGGANNLGKIDIFVMNNGGYGTILTAKKEVNRDVDISFDLHSKQYHITNSSPIQIKVSYTPTTAGETITLSNVTGWVKG